MEILFISSVNEGKEDTYDIGSRDPSGGRFLQSKEDVGKSTIVPWCMVVPWVVLTI